MYVHPLPICIYLFTAYTTVRIVHITQTNASKYLKKSNKTVRDMDNIDFLKNKVLDYINSLNVGHNDKIIDSVYNSVSKLIDSKSE